MTDIYNKKEEIKQKSAEKQATKKADGSTTTAPVKAEPKDAK